MKRFLIVLIALCILDLTCVTVYYFYAERLNKPLESHLDVGVVFHTQDRHLLETRMARSVGLVLSGDVNFLKTVGGMRPLEDEIGAVDMALHATLMGVPHHKVSAEHGANDTISSLHEVSSSIELLSAETVLFVSECMHLVRVYEMNKAVDWGNVSKHYACSTLDDPIKIWKRAHYEAIAWGVSLLPENQRRYLIAKLRP